MAYDLVRTNQLDKSNLLYARLLLDLFGDNIRQINGAGFPAQASFRPYLGPAGFYMFNQTDGWFLVGCALRKQ